MQKFLLLPATVVIIAFSLVTLPQSSTKALALAPCQSTGQHPGFNFAGQTWGSVVTLCASYIEDKTKALVSKPKTRSSAKSIKKTEPKGLPKSIKVDPSLAVRLLHRRLAMSGNNSFTPTRLVIQVSRFQTMPGRLVGVSVPHNRQYRTAYLLGRFVSLRFTPMRVDFHFDSKTRESRRTRNAFGTTVRFLAAEKHLIRGIVTYLAEFRVNGEKSFRPVAGSPVLAAIPAQVFVTTSAIASAPPRNDGKKSYLVASDCLFQLEKFGCLN